MGDAILAFFGAPIAHEDDPQRAVLAGLEILKSIEPYKVAIKRDWGLDFDVRVGINTGLVVVGEVGSDLRVEYTALGDAVSLSAQTATFYTNESDWKAAVVQREEFTFTSTAVAAADEVPAPQLQIAISGRRCSLSMQRTRAWLARSRSHHYTTTGSSRIGKSR